MPSVCNVMQEQRRFENATPLKNSLGDGFLFSKNLIFRNIRNEALSLGVTFSSRFGLYNYHTCVHLAFQKIVRDKRIPYLKNTMALFKMGKELPDLPIGEALEIKRNNILHESAHLLAFGVLQEKYLPNNGFIKEKDVILSSLISESYATACETVGQLFVADPIHSWMYRQNANLYGCEGQEYNELLAQVSGNFGIRFSLMVSIFSFLCWNFYVSNLDLRMLETIINLCDPSVKVSTRNRAMLLKFCNFHFRIHNWFRYQVAEFYFRSHGISRPIASVLSFDFLDYFVTRKRMREDLDQLVSMTISD